MPAPRQQVPQVALRPVTTSRGEAVAGWESDSSYSYSYSPGEESAATSEDLPARRDAVLATQATQTKARKAWAEASSEGNRLRRDSSTSRSSGLTSYSRSSPRTTPGSSAWERSPGGRGRAGRGCSERQYRSRSLRRRRGRSGSRSLRRRRGRSESRSLRRRRGRSRRRSLQRCRSRGRSTSHPRTRLRTPRQAERQGRRRREGRSSAGQRRHFAQPVAQCTLRQRLDAPLCSLRSIPSPPRTLAERLDAPLTREENVKRGKQGDKRTVGKNKRRRRPRGGRRERERKVRAAEARKALAAEQLRSSTPHVPQTRSRSISR